MHESLNGSHLKNEDVVALSQFGIPWSPMDFCNRAVSCGHPRGMAVHLPDVVTRVLRENLSMEPAELALHRCRELTRWTMRAKQLAPKEEEFKANLAPHLKVLLAKKRLLVLQEMLDYLQYPDRHLVRDISQGFRLTGWQDKTGVFPKCVKRPNFSIGTLRQMAKGLNRSICEQLGGENDGDETVQQTWEKTLEEVSLGYIWRDTESDAGEVLLAKRFGLQQKAGKLRVIDDCSIGGINGALGVVEKYRVHAIDETAAYIAWMLDYMKAGGRLEGLSGRTYDMKHAYKQYGISVQDRQLVRLAVRDPSSTKLLYLVSIVCPSALQDPLGVSCV